jgi:hypothetical protein
MPSRSYWTSSSPDPRKPAPCCQRSTAIVLPMNIAVLSLVPVINLWGCPDELASAAQAAAGEAAADD